MKIMRAFKTELDLNNLQKTACIRHAGAARFAYNWDWRAKKKPSLMDRKHPLPSTCTVN
jgi:putative transposase